MPKEKGFPWGWFIAGGLMFFVFIGIFFFVIIFSLLLGIGSSDTGTGNVAVIPVKGVIVAEGSYSILGEDMASSSDIVEMVRKADKDPGIDAIIIEINSPGGSPVASDEIGQAIKSTSKPTVAWIRDVGASGGYWVASACDTIVANRMSIVGSIGVIGSYLDLSGLLNRYNVSYERLVAGKYKDIGSPYRSLTDEERAMFQNQLDRMHDIFILEIAQNRNMTLQDVRDVGEGMFYIGIDAKQLKLVDILGGEEEAVAYIEQRIGKDVELVHYQKKRTFLDVLASAMNENSFYIGEGIGSSFTQSINRNSYLY